MLDISLSCNCGNVQGLVVDAGIKNALRFVCYCDDCKSFAHHLNRENVILDEFGGTGIYQVASYNVKLTKGSNQLSCVMLRKNGLFRWFTKCCKTPIGTTMSDKVAFCGINHCFIDNVSQVNELTGQIKGYLFYKNSTSLELSKQYSYSLMLRMILKNINWKIKRFKKSSPFFDSNGNPVVKPHILN